MLRRRLPGAAQLLIEPGHGQGEDAAVVLSHDRLGLDLLRLRRDLVDVTANRLLFLLFQDQVVAGPSNLAGGQGLKRRVLDLQAGHHDHDNHDADDAGHDIEERIGIDGFFLFDVARHSWSVIVPPTRGRRGHSLVLHPSSLIPFPLSLILHSYCFLSMTSPLPSRERARSDIRVSAPGTT